ncbi:hypothetical protein E4T44_13246 [Aureobasidium sp. EXF-8845]|nr:hypothetical protein E4T44_13246 [Aureobasidium sp. EXF-8845]KAI4823052.1 hypothetical protein E4T45_10462 [Aureobasidium sp. EXF-8846]
MHDQWYMHTHPVRPEVPKFHHGYEQDRFTPPVSNTSTQNPVTYPDQIASTEHVVMIGQNKLVTIPSEQPFAYYNGAAVGCGRLTSPAIEFNLKGHLESEERRCSAAAEKESLTPAQRRRKAQNLAAQRAFRNRKRRREEELETQLSALQMRTDFLESDNERLERELLLAQDENRMLRSIVQSQPSSNALQSAQWRKVTEPNQSG